MVSHAAKRERHMMWAGWSGTLILAGALAAALTGFVALLPPALREWALKSLGHEDLLQRVTGLTGSVMAAVLFVALAFVVPRVRSYRAQIGQVLYERLFATLDTDVIQPLQVCPVSADGLEPLVWIAPSTELGSHARLGLWNAMHEWVCCGADLAEPRSSVFTWALLVGHPGAGKSRMAVELALALQHQQDISAGKAGARSIQHQLKMRLRRARRRPALLTDPWDVGAPILDRDVAAGVPGTNKQAADRRWQNWSPRAPTLLVIDDPRAGEASDLIRRIAAQCHGASRGPAAFPVRLLIVSQTFPADLGLRPEQLDTGRWRSELPGFVGEPWVVTRRHYFTEKELVAVLQRQFPDGPDARRWGPQQDHGAFVLTREGHPLLVESLIQWLRDQSPKCPPALDKLTAQRLLSERAVRLRAALASAGISGHGPSCLMAAATIAGGIPRAGEHEQIVPPLPVAALQRAFPNDRKLDVRTPPIRPDLIGYAYADLVVGSPPDDGQAWSPSPETQQATARTISRLGWTAAPAAMLLGLDRLNDPALQRFAPPTAVRQLLIEALDDVPDDLPGEDAETLLRVFVGHHLRVGCRAAVMRARFAAARVESARDVVCHGVFDELSRPGSPILPSAPVSQVLSLFSLALERGLDEVVPGDATWALLVEAVQRLASVLEPRGTVRVDLAPAAAAGFARFGSMLADALLAQGTAHPEDCRPLLALLQAIWMARPLRRTALPYVARALAEHTANPADESVILGIAAKSVLAALAPTSDDMNVLIAWLDELSTSTASDPQAHYCVAWVWAMAAYGAAELMDQGLGLRCVQAVDRLATLAVDGPAANEPPDIGFALLQVAVRCRLAYCLRSNGSGEDLEVIAREVDVIATSNHNLSRAAQLAMAEWSASAWRWAATAYARTDAPDHAERSARQVLGLADRLTPLAMADEYREACEWSSIAWAQTIKAWLHRNETIAADRCAESLSRLLDHAHELPVHHRYDLIDNTAEAFRARVTSSIYERDGAEAEIHTRKLVALLQPFDCLPLSERMSLMQPLALSWANTAAAFVNAGDAGGAGQAVREVQTLFDDYCIDPSRWNLRIALAINSATL